MLNLKKPLAFFDLETTGLNIAQDRIIEICFVKVGIQGDRKVLTKRINPEMKISPEAIAIHGITDEDVKDAPTFGKIAKELAQFIEGCDLAGFNIVKFDLPMLVEEFLRANVDFKYHNRCLVDAQKIFFLMEPRNLAAALKFYTGKTLEGAHSAEADTLATVDILEAQIQRYENVKIRDDKTSKEITPIANNMQVLHQLTISNQLDFAGRFALNAAGEPVVNFGKHKDKTVAWVLKNEPSYYDWFMKADFSLDSKRRFTELKLNLLNS